MLIMGFPLSEELWECISIVIISDYILSVERKALSEVHNSSFVCTPRVQVLLGSSMLLSMTVLSVITKYIPCHIVGVGNCSDHSESLYKLWTLLAKEVDMSSAKSIKSIRKQMLNILIWMFLSLVYLIIAESISFIEMK